MCMLALASTPSRVALKVSTTSGISSGRVVAAGSSIWTHSAPRLDEPCDVRTHHVTRHLHPKPPPSFGPLRSGTEHDVFSVVLVVGPVHDGVGASERGLDGAIRVRPDELELFEIVGPLHERLLDDGSLGVVLVVEGADDAAGLEALRVPDRVIVHLAAALLAVVAHVHTRVF